MKENYAKINIKEIIVSVVLLIILAIKLMDAQKDTRGVVPHSDNNSFMLENIEVIDGDTIKARLGTGKRETIRIIGIDAPEKDGPYTEYECYGREASDALAEFLEQNQGEIYFTYDSTQSTHDGYDRILAHVFVGEVLVSEYMAREGYVVSYPYGKKSIYAKDIEQGEREAQNNKVGLWDICVVQKN